MKEIKMVIEPSLLYEAVVALQSIPSMPAFVVSEVRLFPPARSEPSHPGEKSVDPTNSIDTFRIECVVPDTLVHPVMDAIERMGNRGVSERVQFVVQDVEERPKAEATRHEAKVI